MKFKSMSQMHEEMFAKARFDGGYPRIVVMGPGIISLAHNEDQFNSLMRESLALHKFMAWGLFVGMPVFLFILWFIYL